MKKEVINKENYKSVLEMLNSSDEANIKMGISILENVDFNKNLTKILMLKKKCNLSISQWQDYSAKLTKKFKKIGVAEKPMLYKQILKLIIENKQSAEDIQFFLDEFANHVFGTIKNLGFDFIEDIDISIKLKVNDKAGVAC